MALVFITLLWIYVVGLVIAQIVLFGKSKETNKRIDDLETSMKKKGKHG